MRTYLVLRWLRLRWCAVASRYRWLPQSSVCYADCPRCVPVEEREQGEAFYREWFDGELEVRRASRATNGTPTNGATTSADERTATWKLPQIDGLDLNPYDEWPPPHWPQTRPAGAPENHT